jgi:hypothetical protein
MNANNNILAFAALRAAAVKAAESWRQLMYPVPFDHTFRLSDSVRVHIRIERYVTEQDTLPVWGTDEDDLITDG